VSAIIRSDLQYRSNLQYRVRLPLEAPFAAGMSRDPGSRCALGERLGKSGRHPEKMRTISRNARLFIVRATGRNRWRAASASASRSSKLRHCRSRHVALAEDREPSSTQADIKLRLRYFFSAEMNKRSNQIPK